jgi:beta-lactamase superfamily II metal-dependent hydrolase
MSKAPNGLNRNVTVRMYNVGFGDCFMVWFPGKERRLKILIDCGMHQAGVGPHKMSEVVHQIVTDALEDGRSRIDVVVATHRHRDHVYGFEDAQWEAVEVREVWMPWTEHPNDPTARAIRDRQSRLGLQLSLVAPLLSGVDRQLVSELAFNSYRNQEAMETLRSGFAGQPVRRYLPHRKRRNRSFVVEALPGVSIHAMGPSYDPEIIRDMEPPNEQAYLQMVRTKVDQQGAFRPFAEQWPMTPGGFRHHWRHLQLTRHDLTKIHSANEGSEIAAAVALERAVNGTSLVLMFQLGKAHLLFGGDAQWGTWRAMLQDEAWVDLLRKTTFYKIAHHGSENATPVEFVENILGMGFSAMASTKEIAIWDRIPREELLKALREKRSRVVRSDRQDVPDPPRFKRTDYYVETTIEC